MADKLTLKGGTHVVGQSGAMQLVLPKKGALHRFPRWWNKKGNIAYVEAVIIKVTLVNGLVVRLVIPTSVAGRTLEIRHDGYGNFSFPVRGGFERVAVVNETDNSLYREYQFAKISGGSVLTRTINKYPDAITQLTAEPVTFTAPEPTPKPVVEKAAEPVVELTPEPKPAKKSKKKKIVVEAPSTKEDQTN